MSAIFISHSSWDKDVATEIRQWLNEAGHRSLFLDFDPEQGIPGGRDWEQELYTQLRQCRAMLVLCSEYWLASKWCFAEFTQAKALGKFIVPIKISACRVTAPLSQAQVVDLTRNRKEGYRRLSSALQRAGLDPKSVFDWDASRPPYPGFPPFEERDAAMYFGRSKIVQEAVEKLYSLRNRTPRMLNVLGASGSGKSSLVRAGVIPRLKRDIEHWLVLEPFRPQTSPFIGLSKAFAAAFEEHGQTQSWEEISQAIEDSLSARNPKVTEVFGVLSKQAEELRYTAKQNEATLLVTIDQFEEIFSTQNAKSQAYILLFLKLLGTISESAQSSLIILTTLRSDFLPELQKYQSDAGLLYDSLSLGGMQTADLAEVIEGPAGIAGLELGSGLVQQMVADTGDPQALPLLAFTLRALYDRYSEDRRLTLDEYQKGLGGVQGAVKRVAEEACDYEFLLEDETALRQAFLNLVRVDEAGRFVRRSAYWKDLPARARIILDRFVKQRLLILSEEQGEPIVEVAHETLFSAWEPLKQWLSDEQKFLLWREQLCEARKRWGQIDRDDSALLAGPLLTEALSWLQSHREHIEDADRVYIAKSEEREETVLRRKEEESRRRIRVRNRWLVILGVVLIMTIISTLMAVRESWRAKTQEGIALQESERAKTQEVIALQESERAKTQEARAFAATARLHHKESVPAALLTAVEAIRNRDTQYTRNTLREFLEQAHSGHVIGMSESIVVAFREDGSAIAAADRTGTLRVWELQSGGIQTIFEHKFSSIVTAIDYESHGDGLVLMTRDGHIYLLNTSDPKQEIHKIGIIEGSYAQSLERHQGGDIWAWHINADAQAVIIHEYEDYPATFSIWSFRNSEVREIIIDTILDGEYEDLIFDDIQRGNRFLFELPWGDYTFFRLMIFDAEHATATTLPDERDYRDYQEHEQAEVLSGDGMILVEALPSKLRLWEVSGTPLKATMIREAQTTGVTVLAISHDKRMVAGAVSGGVRLWNTKTLEKEGGLLKESESVTSLVFSHDDKYLAVGFNNGDIHIWDVSNPESTRLARVLRGHEEKITKSHLVFSSDGKFLISATNYYDEQENPGHFTKFGHYTIRSWDVDMNKYSATRLSEWLTDDGVKSMIKVACEFAGRNLTAKEWCLLRSDGYRATCLEWPLTKTEDVECSQ